MRLWDPWDSNLRWHIRHLRSLSADLSICFDLRFIIMKRRLSPEMGKKMAMSVNFLSALSGTVCSILSMVIAVLD